ncbi:MAG: HAD family hydrolase [Thermoleophilaceae bacterium]
MSGPGIVIFDFDGVILESADIKTRAFARLFESHAEHVQAIVDLHLELAGVSRFEKFRLIYRDILDLPLDEAEMERLGTEFSGIALEEILRCPFVPGAREFLKARHESHALYVASGTPEEELRGIVRDRDLARYFRGVYGTPALKADISLRILEERSAEPSEAVFVGDAMTDLEGARGAGVPFVGRVAPGDPDPFASEDVPVVADLRELALEWPRICAELHSRSAA